VSPEHKDDIALSSPAGQFLICILFGLFNNAFSTAQVIQTEMVE
jgi:hypothetical protein